MANTAFAATIKKVYTVAQAQESDTAGSVTTGGVVEALNKASETEVARAAVPKKEQFITVNKTLEYEVARAWTAQVGSGLYSNTYSNTYVGPGSRQVVLQASESDTARTITPHLERRRIATWIGETETAREINAFIPGHYPFSAVAETEVARDFGIHLETRRFLGRGLEREQCKNIIPRLPSKLITYNVLNISPINNPSLFGIILTSPEVVQRDTAEGEVVVRIRGQFYEHYSWESHQTRDRLLDIQADHQPVEVVYRPHDARDELNGMFYITNARVGNVSLPQGLYEYRLDLLEL